jgi:tRNA U54 and U55 pseudouridine synthase Pus10
MSDLIRIPAKAKEIVKNKRTGKVYTDKADFDADVANPDTDTTADDFRQDLEITVASLHTQGDTIK